MNIAEQLEQEEKYEEAYAEYQKMLSRKEGDVEILTRLAHLSSILNKREDAKIYYAKILEADPSNILAHEQLLDIFVDEDKFKYYLLRGNMHALQQQMSYAKSDYKKAINNAKEPKEAIPARYLYAGLCEGEGKITDAIDEYLRIADYDENPMVYLKLADLYEKSEGIISSIQILERAKKALPESKKRILIKGDATVSGEAADFLTLKKQSDGEDGIFFPYGSTGLFAIGDGRFYFSRHFSCKKHGQATSVQLYKKSAKTKKAFSPIRGFCD